MASIKAFFQESETSTWIELPSTSDFLNDNQLIPQEGNILTIVGNDGIEILGLEGGDFKHMCTVKKLWYNHSMCDVAVVIHYETF